MAKAVKSEALDLYCKLQANFNVVIAKSTLGGRGLFATEFIKKGSLILFNKPTAYGPRANCNVKKFCSKCFKISDLCYPCEKCYAFVCSEICNISSDRSDSLVNLSIRFSDKKEYICIRFIAFYH